MDDCPPITERRPLGAASIVGNRLVRVHRRLGCPHCGRTIPAHAAREIPYGWALTCPDCHTDIICEEAL
jgi:hypothetical protein